MKKGFAAERKRDAGTRTALGTLLIDKGLIDGDQLDEALRLGTDSGERLGEVLVRMNWVSEEALAQVLAEQWNLRCLERSAISFDPNALAKLSREDATTLEALPMQIADDGSLVVAVAEPTEARLFALRSRFGDRIECVVIPKTALDVGLRGDLLAKTTPNRLHALNGDSRPLGQFEQAAVEDDVSSGPDEIEDVAELEPAVVDTVAAIEAAHEPEIEHEAEVESDEEPGDELPPAAALPAFDDAALALGVAVEEQLGSLRSIVAEAVEARERAEAKARDAEAAATELKAKLREHEESIRDLQGTLRTIADKLLPPPSFN